MKPLIKTLFLFTLILVANSTFSQNFSSAKEMRNKAKELFYKENKKDSACILLENAAALYPKDTVTYMWLGTFYSDLKQHDKALNTFNKVLSIDPEDVYSLTYKAKTCYYLSKYECMENNFRKALQINPNNAGIYYIMIQLHYLTGQYKKVISEVPEYIKLGGDADIIFVYNLMSKALLRQFDKINLPPPEWNPGTKKMVDLNFTKLASPWLEQICASNIDDPDHVLGINRKESTQWNRYTFLGSKESPMEYAYGFYLWDATVIFDEFYGILISNGSKIKYESVINNVEVIKYGTVKNWSIVWE
ncbi:MAG: hypothetical protein K9I94_00275 [Bacteroidales bacterium]|nr:hypothetical protein [Bacteroidales bacterium]